jgi:hypothetical protein
MNNIWGARTEYTMDTDDYKIVIGVEPNGNKFVSIIGDKFPDVHLSSDKLSLLLQALNDAINQVSLIDKINKKAVVNK